MKKISLYSLSALTLLLANTAAAEQTMTIPTLEGGITASVGTWYAVPSADNNQVQGGQVTEGNQRTVVRDDGDYGFAWQASLGYIFDETANGIELSYRGISNDNEESFQGSIEEQPSDINYSSNYELTNFDLMLSQFISLGESMQMRFLGGLSYVELEQEIHETAVLNPQTNPLNANANVNSDFTGLGPRVGIDARYDFGQGFGIVGGGSAAYYLGELDYNNSYFLETVASGSNIDNRDNHAVTNLRANLGIDYVYYFENQDTPTMGLELGYQVDYYADAVARAFDSGTDTISATFSGPYLNIKGMF